MKEDRTVKSIPGRLCFTKLINCELYGRESLISKTEDKEGKISIFNVDVMKDAWNEIDKRTNIQS